MAKKSAAKNKESDVPSNTKKSQIIVGVDEAGRGPILGPMVMVALAVEEKNLQKLKKMGVKDSKKLSPQVREELFEKIRAVVHDFRVEVIEPDAIDLSLKESSSNLNWLEADTAARIVSELNPDKAIIDCPSPNIEGYKRYLEKKLSPEAKEKMELVLEHKADENHVIVGAASVIAKVIRDRSVEVIKKKIKVDFGSGYLHDPKTQDFLENYHDKHPELFRRMWQPYKDRVERTKQKSLDEF